MLPPSIMLSDTFLYINLTISERKEISDSNTHIVEGGCFYFRLSVLLTAVTTDSSGAFPSALCSSEIHTHLMLKVSPKTANTATILLSATSRNLLN